jgi:hypothetical protein
MMYCPGSGGQVRVPRSVSQDRRGKERSRKMGKIFFIGLPVDSICFITIVMAISHVIVFFTNT